MPPRGSSEAQKLLPCERFARATAARLRIQSRPGWRAGRLVLTSDRIIFTPDVDHPRLGVTALSDSDIRHASSTGRDRLLISSAETDPLFHLPGAGASPAGLLRRRAEPWIAAIAAARATACLPCRPKGQRRAAG